MKSIEEMIKELCPEGVEYVKLGEVCKVTIGEFVHKDKQSDSYEYPVYNGGTSFSGFYDSYNNEGGKVLVSARGANAGFVNYESRRYWAGNSCYSLSAKACLNILYLYYYLKNSENNLLDNQQKGGGIPAISKKQMENFRIPLPPLPIQQQIVDTLDKFTSLISNIDKEIELRQKQYEYYREKLLTFSEDDESVEWKKLGECFDTRNGYTPSTKNEDFWNNGNIPWFKMEDIRENGHILDDSQNKITEKAIKGKGLFKANSIILATSATIGEHALIRVPHLSNQRFTNFYPKENYEEVIDMKFVYHFFYILDGWCKEHTIQGNFAGVNMTDLYKYKFPIPSLPRQREIVSTLDKFEAVLANLKRERELRQKQYEYYREKLLTF